LSFAGSGLALAQDKGAGAPVDAVAPNPHSFDYHLGAGDKLRIIVFGEDALTGEFFVSGGGKIAFPLIGDIDVLGLTIPEIQAAVEAKLKDGYLKQPKVSAEVLNYRPFYILGEVQKPGEYPFSNGLTVMNAVATANGFTYRANTKRVYIKRADSTEEQEFPLTSTMPVATRNAPAVISIAPTRMTAIV